MLVSIFQNLKLNSTKWVSKTNSTKVNIAGVEGEFTVEGVNGTLKDEVDVEESQEGTIPVSCTIHSYNG